MTKYKKYVQQTRYNSPKRSRRRIRYYITCSVDKDVKDRFSVRVIMVIGE